MNNSLQILGVIDEDPFHYQTWSGISHYFFRTLKERDVLYDAISAQPPRLSRWYHQLRSFNIDVEKWRFTYHLNTRYFDRMTQAALQKLSDIDQRLYNVILQVGAWYDVTKTRDKTTVSYHDGNLHTRLKSPYGYPRISQRWIKDALTYEKRLYDNMDHIFTMSKWLADSFVSDFAISSTKITPVGAGINLPYVKSIGDKRYDGAQILFVGRDFKRKGGRQLLEAFKTVQTEIKDARLTIIGAALSNLHNSVTCLDYVSKHTKGGIELLLGEYASASVFVMPSLYEPFGIAFAEAMAHKLPCIGTNVCAIPEIIDDGYNGYLVPPEDSKALARRIIELLKDPEMCREMGENAYSKYLANYTWHRVIDRIIEGIQSTVSR